MKRYHGRKLTHIIICLLTALLIAIPFAVYLMAIGFYAINIPVWDDYVTHLDIVNTAINTPGMMNKLQILASPMNGHVPFLPRLLLYLQFLAGVSAPLYTAVIISNFGWMLATAGLICLAHRSYHIAIMYLIPVPYLMLGLSHWEAMDFYSSAFQMYWGSGLLAVVGLMAITRNKPLTASLCFWAGLFSSGGTLAVYPITLLYLLITKRWKTGLLFIIYTFPVCWLYLLVNAGENNSHPLPNPLLLFQYVCGFVGNVIANGQWDLTGLAWTHRIIGLVMIMAAVYFCWKIRGLDAIKLIFCYVCVMAALAGYARMSNYVYPVSRYGMYALLALTCLYLLYIQRRLGHTRVQFPSAHAIAVMAIFFSMALWLYNSWLCRAPLQANRDQKIASMEAYLKTGDPAQLNAWNAQHAQKVLSESINTGLYDYRTSLHH